MSIVQWIWLVSLLAAAGFTIGGYLLGARQSSSVRRDSEEQAHRIRDRLSLAESKLLEIRGERDEAVNRNRELVQVFQRITAMRDNLAAERDTMLAQRKSLLSERDAVAAERDASLQQRNEALTNLNVAIADRDQLIAERDALRAEREALHSERQTALAQRDALRADNRARQQEQQEVAAHIGRLNRALRETEASVQQHRTALQKARAQQQRAQSDAQQAEARAALLDEARAAEQTAQARMEELEAELSKLQAQLTKRNEELNGLERDKDHLALLASRAEASERALADAHDALEASRRDLETTRRALDDLPKLEQVAAERDEFLLEIDTLRRRMERVEVLEDQAASAAELAAVKAELETQLEAAAAEVERLRALGFVQPNGSTNGAPAPNIELSSLEGAIEALASADGHRVTVVADELGFPVVGLGTHQEHLAALCGVINDVQRRARTIMPLGQVRRITLETEHAVTVSACSEEDADPPLTLATVATGPGTETSALRQTLANVTAALRRDRGTADRRES